MALAPWNVLAGGKIRTDEEEERRRQTGEKGRTFGVVRTDWERNEKEKTICKALEKVAAEIGAKHITSGTSKLKISSTLADVSSSCHCISHAENTLCFPDCRRSKGRAFDGQYRGIGNHVKQ